MKINHVTLLQPKIGQQSARWTCSQLVILTCCLLTLATLTDASSRSIQVIVNDQPLGQDHCAVIVDGAIMVPLEPLAEALGARVEYDMENDIVRLFLATGDSSVLSPDESEAESGVSCNIVVFIAKNGAKYHRQGCRYLASGGEAMSLDSAKQRGYDPCKVCDPPQ